MRIFTQVSAVFNFEYASKWAVLRSTADLGGSER